MTFGQILKQMLQAGDIKIAALASTLGYDVSYVSRWLNDLRLPSLKYNKDLFQKIATFIVVNCSQDELQALVSQFALSVPEETPAHYEEIFADYLKSAYLLAHKKSTTQNTHDLKTTNCFLTHELSLKKVQHHLKEIFSLSKEPLSCITTTPLHHHRFQDAGLFQLPSQTPSNHFFTLHQVINLDDFKHHLDTYCATISVFLTHPNVHYTFYEVKEPFHEQLIIIKDKLLLEALPNPFSTEHSTLLCQDSKIVNHYYESAENFLSEQKEMLRYLLVSEAFKANLFYDYMMSDQYCYLLAIMHPIYMSETLHYELKQENHLSNQDTWRFFQNKTYNNAPKRIVIHNATLVNYFYEGQLILDNQIITLSPEQRKEHLKKLIYFLEHSKESQLTIIKDENPLLNLADFRQSIYLSQDIAFSACFAKGQDTCLAQFKSIKLIAYFNQFFNHLEQLPKEFVVEGQAAIDFLKKGHDML